MTRMIFFLAEYAEELSVLLCGLMLVLLLVTLHRMKRITKLIQEIAGNTNDVRETKVQCELEEKKPPVPVEECNKGQKTVEDMLTQNENADLLSEVLEEVFL